MEYAARWGQKGFIISANKIVPLMDLSTSISAKDDVQDEAEGTKQTNDKGRELQTISLSTIYLSGAGVDPRAQVDEWDSLVGTVNPLYIGGKRFGPAKMKLKTVTADIVTNNVGRFIQAEVKLVFEEYSEKKSTITATNNSASATSSSASRAASVYAETVAKKTAMNASASPTDKAARKPSFAIQEVAIR